MTETANAAAAEIANMPFEQALKELETIVGQLEQGAVDLEKSIEIYERGEMLKKHCEKLLSNAEGKIQKIRTGSEGEAVGAEDISLD